MTDARDTREMERCFLGCLLLAVTENETIQTRLQPDDFDSNQYGQIYKTILKQRAAHTVPTIQTLRSELSKNKNDKDYIPVDVIADITNSVSSAANIPFYEGKVFEASKTRLFIKALRLALEEVEGHTDTDTVIKNLLPDLAAVITARNEAGIKTAGELLKMQFPEIRWIIKGLIGEGLTMINGAPKIGKSWLVLNLAIAAASGGAIMGELQAEKTDTLYLALEDTERRIQSRLKKLNAPDTDNLKITTQWRDGYMGLEKYLQANSGIGLVIIDTLARFADIEDMNDYSITTNAMARLKRIADDLKIAVVLIHHAKKTGARSSGADWMESALGSTGLTGATDSTIFIDRKNREKPEATLYATGRDAADIKYNLKFDLDFGGWSITSEPPKQEAPDNSSGKKKAAANKTTSPEESGALVENTKEEKWK